MPEQSAYSYITHRQDAYSGAYIRAVCAVAGCGIDRVTLDNDKIDYIITSRVKGTVRTKPKIDIQAKCERGLSASVDPFPYVLDIETFNNLRDPRVINPRILVVVLVPEDAEGWVTQSEAEFVLRHCAYWVSLKGLPDSENVTGQTVYLRRGNVFTPAALWEMMERTANGLELS